MKTQKIDVEIDKIKGISTKPMCNSWFAIKACEGDPYLKSICASVRPYFMAFSRDDYKAKYNTFKKRSDFTRIAEFGEDFCEKMDKIEGNAQNSPKNAQNEANLGENSEKSVNLGENAINNALNNKNAEKSLKNADFSKNGAKMRSKGQNDTKNGDFSENDPINEVNDPINDPKAASEAKNASQKLKSYEKWLSWRDKKSPLGMGPCAMNRICWYVTDCFEGYKWELKHPEDGEFDYHTLMAPKKRVMEKYIDRVEQLLKDYVEQIAIYKKEKVVNEDKGSAANRREVMKQDYRAMLEEICPDDDTRLNVVVELCYGRGGNKMFCWDMVGDLICKRLMEYEGVTELGGEFGEFE